MYYDDPLAAAYMAREFGVEFIWGKQRVEHCLGMLNYQHQLQFEIEDEEGDWKIYEGRTYHIYPGSLPIFEPQEGDIIQFDKDYIGHCRVLVNNNKPYDSHYGICFSELPRLVSHHNQPQIIQRNGKPFFYPKSEEVCGE